MSRQTPAWRQGAGLVSRHVDQQRTIRTWRVGAAPFQNVPNAAQSKAIPNAAQSKAIPNAAQSKAIPNAAQSKAMRKAFDKATTAKDTLYIGNLPGDADRQETDREVGELFKLQPGYSRHLAQQSRKGLQVLVQFASVEQATGAMERLQGAQLLVQRAAGYLGGMKLSYSKNRLGEGRSLCRDIDRPAPLGNWRATTDPHVPTREFKILSRANRATRTTADMGKASARASDQNTTAVVAGVGCNHWRAESAPEINTGEPVVLPHARKDSGVDAADDGDVALPSGHDTAAGTSSVQPTQGCACRGECLCAFFDEAEWSMPTLNVYEAPPAGSEDKGENGPSPPQSRAARQQHPDQAPATRGMKVELQQRTAPLALPPFITFSELQVLTAKLWLPLTDSQLHEMLHVASRGTSDSELDCAQWVDISCRVTAALENLHPHGLSLRTREGLSAWRVFARSELQKERERGSPASEMGIPWAHAARLTGSTPMASQQAAGRLPVPDGVLGGTTGEMEPLTAMFLPGARWIWGTA